MGFAIAVAEAGGEDEPGVFPVGGRGDCRGGEVAVAGDAWVASGVPVHGQEFFGRVGRGVCRDKRVQAGDATDGVVVRGAVRHPRGGGRRVREDRVLF